MASQGADRVRASLLGPVLWAQYSAVLLQGPGLHALNRTGLLLPVVPAPVHQPARALVWQLLLPVPGSGYGKCATSPRPGSGEPHCQL